MPVATSHPSDPDAADLLARRAVAGALALALRDPTGHDAPGDECPSADLLGAAWEVLSAPHSHVLVSSLGVGELPPCAVAPGPLIRWLALPVVERRAAYRAVFGLVFSRHCPPCETEYCESKDVFYRSQQMADIGGFFRAFGLRPDSRAPERVDHAAMMIGFVAFLLGSLSLPCGRTASRAGEDLEREAVVRAALASFIRDHCAWWMPTFGRCLERRAQEVSAAADEASLRSAATHLAGVGRVLRAWVAAERLNAGVDPSRRILEPALADAAADDACPGVCNDCGDAAPISV